MDTDKSNVRLRDNVTGKCLGVQYLSDRYGSSSIKPYDKPLLSMVKCNENDMTQRWDVSDAYNKFGTIRRPYKLTNTSEFKDLPDFSSHSGDTIYIDHTDSNSYPEKYHELYLSHSKDGASGLRPKYQLDSSGQLRTNFFIDDPNISASKYDGCINGGNTYTDYAYKWDSTQNRTIQDKKKTFYVPSWTDTQKRSITDDDYEYNCRSKWDIIYTCDPNNAPSDKYECDEMTGKFKLMSGYWGPPGKEIYDPDANGTADAYNRLYRKCRDSVDTGTTLAEVTAIRDLCGQLHKTQDWLTPDLIPFWDVAKKTQDKLYEIENLSLIHI